MAGRALHPLCLVALALLAATAGCLTGEQATRDPERLDEQATDPEPAPANATVDEADVELAVDDEANLAWPGTSVTAQAQLAATPSIPAKVSLELDTPSDWEAEVAPTETTLAEPTSIEVSLTVPSEADRQPPPILLDARSEQGQRVAQAEIPIAFLYPRLELTEEATYARPGEEIDLAARLHEVPDQLGSEISVDAPEGWEDSVERDHARADDEVVNVTVQVGRQAQPGSEHAIELAAVTQAGERLAEASVEVSVAEAYRAAYGSPPSTRNVSLLVVPPAHGPIANAERGVLPQGTDGAQPGGAYLAATMHALADWRWALDRVAENRTELAWLTGLTWETTVVAEDEVEPQHVREADIVKAYAEASLPAMGVGLGQSASEPAPDCLAYSAKAWPAYGSLTYEDMYQLSIHELFHCFGQGHVEDGQPQGDIMTATHEGPIEEVRCPSNLNVLATAAAYTHGHPGAVFAQEVVEGRETVAIAQPAYERYCSPHTEAPPPEPLDP